MVRQKKKWDLTITIHYAQTPIAVANEQNGNKEEEVTPCIVWKSAYRYYIHGQNKQYGRIPENL